MKANVLDTSIPYTIIKKQQQKKTGLKHSYFRVQAGFPLSNAISFVILTHGHFKGHEKTI